MTSPHEMRGRLLIGRFLGPEIGMRGDIMHLTVEERQCRGACVTGICFIPPRHPAFPRALSAQRKELTMNMNQIDDDYIRSIQEGLERILEELMREEK